jgi:hypothetical protein
MLRSRTLPRERTGALAVKMAVGLIGFSLTRLGQQPTAILQIPEGFRRRTTTAKPPSGAQQTLINLLALSCFQYSQNQFLWIKTAL